MGECGVSGMNGTCSVESESTPYIHLSIFYCLSGFRSRGQSPTQGSPDFPLPSYFSQLFRGLSWGIPRPAKRQSLQRVVDPLWKISKYFIQLCLSFSYFADNDMQTVTKPPPLVEVNIRKATSSTFTIQVWLTLKYRWVRYRYVVIITLHNASLSPN